MNTLGTILRLTTFGESHGPAMGGILDGMPPRVKIDMEEVQSMIDRRRTGRDPLTSQRKETDIPEVLSGLSPEGLTLGTPIGFIFRNADSRSRDYDQLAVCFRPNHADYTYACKYGIRDHRGGGRASARETVSWVMGGALAMQWLKNAGISIEARVTGVGHIGYYDPLINARMNPAADPFCFDEAVENAMRHEVELARARRDSVGGRVSCVISGVPAGLGNPVFGKAQARLAEAMMSLNAVKAFEYGAGSQVSGAYGSESIDEFAPGFKPFPFTTNHQGGILGGITSGMSIYFNLHFKPTPTLPRPVNMADAEGNISEILVGGRHDPCVALRAPVIVEALAALTIADLMLLSHESLV